MDYPGEIQLDDYKSQDGQARFWDAVNRAISDARILRSKVEMAANTNFDWWQRGTNETDVDLLHPKKSKAIDNRIFTNLESIIPVWTANTPDATILNVDNTVREKIANALVNAYEVDQKMNQKLQKLIRNWCFDRIGIAKYRWNKERLDNGFTTEVVLSKKVGFDPHAKSLETCDFVWEEMDKTTKDIADIFNKKEEMKKIDPELKARAKYYEIWAGRGAFVCWVIPEHRIVLDAMENPNYNYDETPKTDALGQPMPVVPAQNIFKRPKYPYLVFNVFDRSDNLGLYDDTSLIEQAAALQMEVNMLERQIAELIEGQKRVWAISADAMSEDKAQQIVNKTGDLVVYYDRGTPNGGIQLPISGKPDGSYYNYLQHLLSEIDNVMGVHAVTRGDQEPGNEILGVQRIKLAGDSSRSDLIVRNIENLIEDWYLAYLQMHKVYSINGIAFESNKEKQVLTREEIPNEVKIMVKKGSTLPADDASRMEMALGLGKIGMIDPKTLFEELGYGNEDERVKALYEWLAATGKINPAVLQAPGAMPGQPGMPGQTGVPLGQAGMPAREAGAPEQPAQQSNHPLDQISNLLASPEFQSLPPEQQQPMLEKIKGLLQHMQQAGNIPEPTAPVTT